jgi:hypothetical protein
MSLIAEWVETAHDLYHCGHEDNRSTSPSAWFTLQIIRSPIRSPSRPQTGVGGSSIGPPARPLMHHQHGLLRITNEELRTAAE